MTFCCLTLKEREIVKLVETLSLSCNLRKAARVIVCGATRAGMGEFVKCEVDVGEITGYRNIRVTTLVAKSYRKPHRTCVQLQAVVGKSPTAHAPVFTTILSNSYSHVKLDSKKTQETFSSFKGMHMKFTFSVRSHRSFVVSSLINVSDFFYDFQNAFNVRIKERKEWSRGTMNKRAIFFFVKTGLRNKKNNHL